MERFCSWPSWISARTRSHSRKGPERPLVPPDHGCDGETVSPSPQSDSQTRRVFFTLSVTRRAAAAYRRGDGGPRESLRAGCDRVRAFLAILALRGGGQEHELGVGAGICSLWGAYCVGERRRRHAFNRGSHPRRDLLLSPLRGTLCGDAFAPSREG